MLDITSWERRKFYINSAHSGGKGEGEFGSFHPTIVIRSYMLFAINGKYSGMVLVKADTMQIVTIPSLPSHPLLPSLHLPSFPSEKRPILVTLPPQFAVVPPYLRHGLAKEERFYRGRVSFVAIL